jgi:hypothetical protein
MSETQTELLHPVSPSEVEVHDAVVKLRHTRIQRSTANVIVAVGVLAVALCFPLMRVVVSDYTIGVQLAMTTANCSDPHAASDVQSYCEQAKHGVVPPAVSVSKALVGVPITPLQAAIAGPAQPPVTAPLHAFLVPGEPGVITIPLPDGTTGRLVLPSSNQPVPQDRPTATVLADPPIKSQPPTVTVIPAAPGSTAGPTTVVPIEPPPATTTAAAAPPPPVVTTTADQPPATTTAAAPPPPASSSAAAPPPDTTTAPAPTQAPPPATDTTTAPAPTETGTQAPQDTTTAQPTSDQPTTTEPSTVTPTPDQPTGTAPLVTSTANPTPTTETTSPSLVGQVVDSLFSSIAGVI